MSLATFAWYVAATGAVLGFLWLVGLPFQLVLDEIAGRAGRAVPSAAFSLFAITTGSWYVLESGHELGKVPILLAAVAALVCVGMVVFRIRRRPPPFDHRHVKAGLGRLWTAVIVFALNMGESLYTFGALYSKRRMTVVSLGNNDIAAYAQEAQHLLEGGFRHPGPIVGTDMAHTGQQLGYGADTLLANAAALLRTDVFHVLHVAMLVAIFLGVYGLVRLLNERLGVSLPVAILSSQAAYSVFFVAYIRGQYFLSQLLAMALLPAFLAILIDVARSRSRRVWASGLLAISALAAAGIAVYPQLTIATAIMFLPAAAFAGRLSGLFHRLLLSATALAGGVALGAAVDPSLTRIGWHTSVDLASVNAGWKLPGLLVTDMFGFQTSAGLHHPLASWVGSAAIVVLLAATIGWLWYRKALPELTAFAAVAVALVLASYLVVFWLKGVSYQQWKWITYLIPLLVSLAMSLLLSAIWLTKAHFAVGIPVALAAGGSYLIAATALAGPASFPASSAPALIVSADTVQLAKSPAVRGLPAINVNVSPYWDTMWVAYFLRNKQLYLQSQSYYRSQPPASDWTLELNTTPATTTDVIAVNTTYRVAHHPKP